MPKVAQEPRERLGRAHRGLRANLVRRGQPGRRVLPVLRVP